MKKLNSKIGNLFLILFFIGLIGLPFGLIAQNNEGTIEKMNSIKSNESYIYGEEYHTDEKIAYDIALSDLLSYINELRFENGVNHKISINDIRPFVKHLSHFDGSKYNIVVYTPKSQIFTDGTDIRSMEQNKPRNADISDNQQSEMDCSYTPIASDIIETLCAQDNWIEIKGFLSEYMNNGRLKDYGISSDLSDFPIDSYRILIDDRYGILAIIAPKNSRYGINIKTNQIDKESNYPNCAVIVWIK